MSGHLSAGYGRVLAALALLGCGLLLCIMIVIIADIVLRNATLPGLPQGLAWSNEVAEIFLYLMTLLVAPWLLRQGQHIRVDVLLQVVPRRLAWQLEWIGDIVGFVCCTVLAWYAGKAAWSSYLSGALNIKTLVTPEWWILAPLPVTFALLAGEMLFRMHRLQVGERGPRHDAVSAA